MKIARREMLSRFEASDPLFRARSEAKDDQEWLAHVEKHAGIIVLGDGMQKDERQRDAVGRDALTGRVRCAEQVRSSETAVRKALLAPVVTWEGNVLVPCAARCIETSVRGG